MVTLSGLSKSGKLRRIVAFTDDLDASDALARLADGGRLPTPDLRAGGLEVALRDPVRADLIIVDVDGATDPQAAMRVLAGRASSPILALGGANDVALYRDLLAAGAGDYLVKPAPDGALAEACLKLAGPPRAEDARAPQAKPRSAAVIGVRGGIGATTLAVSLAWLAAERIGRQTALVDLDLQFGACALALDLLPGRGLREALQNPDRIDALFVGSAMINAGERLFVLGGEDPLDRDSFISPEALQALIAAVQESVECLILDLPRSLAVTAPALLEELDQIVLLTDFSVPGLRDTLRFKAFLAEHSKARAVSIVAQDGPDKPAISRKEFEKGMDQPLASVLPFNRKLANQAATGGLPLAALLPPGGVHAKALSQIAGDLAGAEAKPKRMFASWRW